MKTIFGGLVILFALVGSVMAACAPPNNTPYRPSQRLIALSFNGDTVANMEGDNCFADAQYGYIYHSFPSGKETVSLTAGTIICKNIP